jgi:hypothetical protein
VYVDQVVGSLTFPHLAGHVDIQKTGEKTKTGADKETFGTGRAAQVRI